MYINHQDKKLNLQRQIFIFLSTKTSQTALQERDYWTRSKISNLPPDEFREACEIVLQQGIVRNWKTQVASYLASKYGISLSQFELKKII
jgi:hypothetical protein